MEFGRDTSWMSCSAPRKLPRRHGLPSGNRLPRLIAASNHKCRFQFRLRRGHSIPGRCSHRITRRSVYASGFRTAFRSFFKSSSTWMEPARDMIRSFRGEKLGEFHLLFR